MILHTKHVEVLPSYRLYVQFDNGVAGEIQLLDDRQSAPDRPPSKLTSKE